MEKNKKNKMLTVDIWYIPIESYEKEEEIGQERFCKLPIVPASCLFSLANKVSLLKFLRNNCQNTMEIYQFTKITMATGQFDLIFFETEYFSGMDLIYDNSSVVNLGK